MLRKSLYWSVLTCILLSLAVTDVFAVQERFALIVGNANYDKSIGSLKNPGNDAAAMTRSLQQKGFDVTFLKNAGKRQMEQAFRAFARKLRTDAVGLFFFAGHAIEVDGENYLIPIGALIEDEVDAKYEAVSVARLLDNMDSAGNGLNLVVLDACRNNPYSRRFRSAKRGLRMMSPPSGTMILYATEPGNVAADGEGENGVFTEHLLKAIDTPGLSVEEAFKQTAIAVKQETRGKQVPWYEGIILGQFSFIPLGSSAGIEKPMMAPAQNNTSASSEMVFWQSVDSRPTQSGYEAYLQAYPDGVFASLASARIKEMKKNTSQARPVKKPGSQPVAIAKPNAEIKVVKAQHIQVRKPKLPLPASMSLLTTDNQIIFTNDLQLDANGKLSFYKGNITDNRTAWEWRCILSGNSLQKIQKGSVYQIQQAEFSSRQLTVEDEDSKVVVKFVENPMKMTCNITANPGDIIKMKVSEFQQTIGHYIELH